MKKVNKSDQKIKENLVRPNMKRQERTLAPTDDIRFQTTTLRLVKALYILYLGLFIHYHS